ncbi:MAG: HDOD domain-containing protein [Burkholderiales bacterium]|nr:HDOD domain-containing protein [Burkholderiales bacterium]
MTSITRNARAEAADAWLHQGAELPRFNPKLADAIARINWEDSNVQEIEKLISSEPAMIAYTLRAANSPFFGLSKRVDSIRHALTVLGVASVRSILMRCYMTDTFGVRDGDKVSSELVTHAILCGIAARELAPGTGAVQDSAFLAGVLLDVGKLLLLTCAREKANLIYDDGNFVADRSSVEVAVFSFDHADLTLATLRTWLMPDTITVPVHDHYRTPAAETPMRRALGYARMFADHAAYLAMGNAADAAKVRARLVAQLSESQVEQLANNIRDEAKTLGSSANAHNGEQQ